MHYLLGFSVDHINTFLLNLSLRGLSRLKPYCVRQAHAITPDHLIQMSTVLNLEDPSDSVYWCLFLFAFFLFARKSNLVPSTQKDFKNKKFLLRNDVKPGLDHLVVSMRWSKTIQFGERVLETPLIAIPGSILCPIAAFKCMCKKVKAKKGDPLFTLPNNSYINYKKFQNKLRHLILAINLDPYCFSTHSFRRGGCSFAFKSNCPSELIQLHGDWKSEAYKRYLSFSIEDKLLVACKMRQHILSK